MQHGWLKFWIGIGTVAAAASLILPPLIVYTASKDVKRYKECIEGRRTDCERTMVWNLVDAAMLLEQQNGGLTGSALGLDVLGAREDSALRTSDNAPFIDKVEPVGMSNADGTYRARSGSEVMFKVTVKGLVTSVELFQIEGVDGKPTKSATLKKGSDEIWTGMYKLPPGFSGSVEVRAIGDDPKDLAVLNLPVAAN